MLYGNVIFIKKLGGDGSKFPVNIGSVKIGRSDDCLIRIQNQLVSSEHCEILIDKCGQAKIKNLSKTNPTILNCKPLGNGEFLLKHKDIFQIGERLARWEYLPSSKYYNESESNLICPVTDVVPQKRMFERSSVRNSESFKCSLKRNLNSTVSAGGPGLDNKLSIISLNPASSEKSFLKRCSRQLRKIPFSPQVDAKGNMKLQSLPDYESQSERKTSLRRTQAWEIQSVSPSNTITVKNKSCKKPTFVKILDNQLSNNKLIKPCTTGILTPDLEAIKDFTPRKKEISSKKFSGFETSDEFLKCFSVESTKSISKLVKTPSSGKIKTCDKYSQKSNRKENLSKQDNVERSVSMIDLKNNASVENHRGSSKFTPSRKSKTRKSLLKKSVSRFRSADVLTSTSVMEIKDSYNPDFPPVEDEMVDDMIKLSRSKSLNSLEFSKQECPILPSQDLNPNSLATIVKSNVKPKKLMCSASEFVNILPVENKSSPNIENSIPKENYNLKKISGTEDAFTGKNDVESRTKKTPRNHGSKRKFTSFVESAERAAKKLKTISLAKPDKNKRAALLMLGKAGNRMKIQNTNTIIKNKIVKKAIKQKRNGRKNSGPLESVQTISTSEKNILKNMGSQDSNTKTYSFDAKQLQAEESKSQLLVKIENQKKNLNKSSLKSLDERSFSKQVKKRAGSNIIKDCDYETNSEIEIKGNGTPRDAFLSSIPNQAFVSEEVFQLKGSKKSENVDVEKKIKSYNINSHSQYDSSEMFSRGTSNESKRSSSKGFSALANFIEASPIAVRLSSRKTENVFKTPEQINRCSFLITPKNKRSSGIIKSASTSKINRKSIKLTSKALNESSISDLNLTCGTAFNFSDIQTPDISTEMFVSPLSERNSLKEKLKTPNFNSKRLKNGKRSFKELNKFPEEEIINKSKRKNKSLKNSEPELYVTMEQWQEENLKSTDTENQQVKISQKSTKKNSKNHSPNDDSIQPLMELPKPIKCNNMLDVKGVHQLMELPVKSTKNKPTDVGGVRRLMKSLRPRKSPKNDLTDVRGVRRLMESPKTIKSPKNDLTDVRGVRRLMKSLRPRKSPKNDLTDVRGVRRLMKSPKTIRSPKNDLTDVRGVRRLMESPKTIKSPKNDLTDVRGVRRLMESPKTIKSPKNDLTDVRGVRRLMESPRRRKSPKNDLTDVRGVRRIMKSLRPRKSLKNDLTDVRGVRRLMESPKTIKSPKNDLTDVRGVRRLMESPKTIKSPKNDLTDVRGVRRLMESPKTIKSPKNDLTDVRGVRRLMESPKTIKSPKNDLTDVRGVRRLMESPRRRKSPKNDLTDVRGVRRLMESPRRRKSPKNDLTDVRGVRRLMESPKTIKSPKNDLTDVRGVRKLMESPKTIKSPKNDLTDVRGVRRLMESPKTIKSPKNDLTHVDGIKHLLGTSKVQKSPQNDLSNVSGLELLFQSSPNKIQSIQSGRSNFHKKDEVHQLFSLNKEENFDFDTSSTGELFISPNKPRSCRKRLGCADNIPYFMQVRVTRSSRGLLNEDTKEIKSPRKIPRRIPKTIKGVEDPKVAIEKPPLIVIQPENTIIESQDKRITRSNKTNKLQLSLISMETKKSKNVFESDFKDKEKEKQQVKDTDPVNVEDWKSSSGKRIYKRAEALSKTSTEKTRRYLPKRNSVAQNPPVTHKITRNAERLIDEKQNEANSGVVRTSKTKKAVSEKATSTKSKTASIRTRRKCIAEESKKLNTRSKTKSETTENSRRKSKTRNCNQSITSPVKTRQQRLKEKSSIMGLRESPVKTRKKEMNAKSGNFIVSLENVCISY